MTASSTRTLRCGDRELVLGARTYVMGVVNATPDSFSDGGRFVRVDDAVAHALRLIDDGADVIDLGGESTRPGAAAVDEEEELRRVLPVVDELARRGVRNLSIDTRNARTARACHSAGASWLNDTTALRHDPAMRDVAPAFDAVVLMHWREAGHTAVEDVVDYDDTVAEVASFLAARVRFAEQCGCAAIVVDPGIGFGKTVEDNLALTRQLARFAATGAAPLPVLYGPSRKRFLGALTGIDDPAARDDATLGAVCAGAMLGADIVRVHDVRRARQALAVVDAVARRDPTRG